MRVLGLAIEKVELAAAAIGRPPVERAEAATRTVIDEPTEYEAVAAEAAPERVRAWVWSNYRSKYVPEEVLAAFGIRDPW